MEKIDTSEYVEWLSRVEAAGGSLAWVSAPKQFPMKISECARPRRRSASEIQLAVLQSRRVQKVITLEAERRGASREEVQADAERILATMGHHMQMCAVRTVGYALAKAMKVLFDGIFFNALQLTRIREHFKDDAVVFIPAHKTYMDFLLISLLCFDLDVPLPAIAAGMDFMHSRFMGEALRRCGAFFIRRHFGNDALYWSIFTEYVQTHLTGADHPVEFFIEGTRSRTGKSLYPKFGLLQILLEPYLRGQLYDMIIVPVTINCDKFLEESLYAYELLGFPKPKESTAGLLKARKIFKKRFGRIFVTFGEPISVRKYFGTSLHRSAFVCQPDSQFTVSAKEKLALKKLGHEVIRIHNRNNIISVWPYACAVLLQLYQEESSSSSVGTVTIGDLLHQLEQFVVLAERLGKKIYTWSSLTDDMSYYFLLHSNIFTARPDCCSPSCVVELAEFHVEEGVVDRGFLKRSIPLIILSNYSNQILSEYADLAIVCVIQSSYKSILRSDSFRHFSELRDLFDREFICLPGDDEAVKSFEAAVSSLERASVLELRDGRLVVTCDESLSLLASLILPFACVYQLTMQTAFGFAGTSISAALLVGETQKRTVELAVRPSHRYIRLSCLSSDPILNAISSLAARRALLRQPDGQYLVDGLRLHSIASTLQSVSPYDIPFDSSLLISKL